MAVPRLHDSGSNHAAADRENRTREGMSHVSIDTIAAVAAAVFIACVKAWEAFVEQKPKRDAARRAHRHPPHAADPPEQG